MTKTVRFRLTWLPKGTKNVMENSLAGGSRAALGTWLSPA